VSVSERFLNGIVSKVKYRGPIYKISYDLS